MNEFVIVARDHAGFFHWHAHGERDYLSRVKQLTKSGAEIAMVYLEMSCEEARRWIESQKADLKKPVKELDELSAEPVLQGAALGAEYSKSYQKTLQTLHL